jgi:hypothetical protein
MLRVEQEEDGREDESAARSYQRSVGREERPERDPGEEIQRR